MKKFLVVLLAAAMMLSLSACSKDASNNDTENRNVKSEGVMTYAEFMAAPMDSEVVIEAYVQGHQSWWNDTINVYAQDDDGGYFIYNMACSQADAEKLVEGTKIKVTGFKSEWSGEVEITDATFEFCDAKWTWTYMSTDVTESLGTDDLAKYMNMKVSFTGMTVEPSTAPDGSEVAFLYNWDGSGTHEDNSDLYFNVSVNGQTYNFTVESYLCDNTTEVYQAVENLKIGDVIDMEGFLYWYNGPNPHITEVTVK